MMFHHSRKRSRCDCNTHVNNNRSKITTSTNTSSTSSTRTSLGSVVWIAMTVLTSLCPCPNVLSFTSIPSTSSTSSTLSYTSTTFLSTKTSSTVTSVQLNSSNKGRTTSMATTEDNNVNVIRQYSVETDVFPKYLGDGYFQRHEDNYYDDDEEEEEEDYDDDDDDSDLFYRYNLKVDSYPSTVPLDDSTTTTTTSSIVQSVNGFLSLQKSTGSDIVDSKLQHQIDQGVNKFLDSHASDATDIERIAMSSITEQLPQAAVTALLRQQQQQKEQQQSGRSSSSSTSATTSTDTVTSNTVDTNTNSNPYRYNLNFVKDGRVTVDEEIQLGRIIQTGVALFQVKNTIEHKLGRSITKQEWAQYSGLSSTKELRRRVSDYRKAKHCLVQANIGLVHTVVKQQYNTGRYKQSGITKDELIQEGALGLLRAAELFDPTRGLKFSTYAVVWIKGTLQNSHVDELVKLPAREKNKWNKIQYAIQTIRDQNSQSVTATSSVTESEPTVEEIAAVTGFSISDIITIRRKMTQTKQVYSLDYEQKFQSRSGADTTKFGDMNVGSTTNNNSGGSTTTLIMDNDEIALIERTQLRADLIATLVQNLDTREARLMRLRYGLSDDGRTRTLHECAESMGISYTRANQIATKCITKLRQAAEINSLEEYLLTIA